MLQNYNANMCEFLLNFYLETGESISCQIMMHQIEINLRIHQTENIKQVMKFIKLI